MSAAATLVFYYKPIVTWTRKPRLDFPKRTPKGLRLTPYDRIIYADIVESQQLGRSTSVSSIMERTGACEKTVYNSLNRLDSAKLFHRETDPGRPTKYTFPWAFACGKQSSTPVMNYVGTPVKNAEPYPYKQKQAEEGKKNTAEQLDRPLVEETFQRSPARESVIPTEAEQAGADEPQPKTEGNYQSLVREAVQRWKMDKDIAPTCPADALRLALSLMPERVQQARQKGKPIRKLGAYLRRMVERIAGITLETPPRSSPRSSSLFKASELIRNMLEGDQQGELYENWQLQQERKKAGEGRIMDLARKSRQWAGLTNRRLFDHIQRSDWTYHTRSPVCQKMMILRAVQLHLILND